MANQVNNETILFGNNTSPVPSWVFIVDISQTVMAAVGMVANLFALFVLMRPGNAFSMPLTIFLKHQSFLDALALCFSIIGVVQPPMWGIGNAFFDYIICHIWHSQALLWWSLFMSGQNLVCIAGERYLAVCRPFYYIQIRKNRVYCLIFCLYVYGITHLSGTVFDVRFVDGQCMDMYAYDGQAMETFFFVFSIYWCVTFSIVPCICFCVFYSKILRRLHQARKLRKEQRTDQTTFSAASREFVKTAITVTVIFVIAMGFEGFYYVLGNTNVTTYVFNSPTQKVSVLFATFNSVANPFVYAILLPTFRRNIQKAMSCREKGTNRKHTFPKPDNAKSTTEDTHITTIDWSTHL